MRKAPWTISVPFDSVGEMVLFSLLLVDSLGMKGRRPHAKTCKIRRKDLSVAFQIACASCSFQKLSRCRECANECKIKARPYHPHNRDERSGFLVKRAGPPTDLPSDVRQFE